MKQLKQLNKVVYAELVENEAARKSDTALLMGVFKRLGIDTQKSFAELRKEREEVFKQYAKGAV